MDSSTSPLMLNWVHCPHRYWGKQEESISQVLEMVLATQGLPCPPHLGCLTLRPFCFTSLASLPTQWLSPSVSAWEGLQHALRLLNIPYRALELVSEDNEAEGRGSLASWLTNGPVIIGPLNRTLLWNRLSSRYHHGSAYFLLVWGLTEDGALLVQDPEGCPHLQLNPTTLIQALHPFDQVKGLLQINLLSQQLYEPSWKSVLVAARDTRQTNPTSGEQIQSVIQLLTQRSPKATEWAALHCALPAMAVAIGEVSAFLSDLPNCLTISASECKTAVAPLLTLLQQVYNECATALGAVTLRNHKAILHSLNTISQLEAHIDEAWRILLILLTYTNVL